MHQDFFLILGGSLQSLIVSDVGWMMLLSHSLTLSDLERILPLVREIPTIPHGLIRILGQFFPEQAYCPLQILDLSFGIAPSLPSSQPLQYPSIILYRLS